MVYLDWQNHKKLEVVAMVTVAMHICVIMQLGGLYWTLT